jgi:hypothetical protein
MLLQPLEGPLGPNSISAPPGSGENGGALFPGTVPPPSGDNISRFVPPWLNEAGSPAYGNGYGNSGSLAGLFGPLMGVLQQLMQVLQSLTGCGGNSPYGGSGCPPFGQERFFQNATGSSEGDPHLSFNGAKWNNMASQPDLLNSNSVPGGFQISTQTTPPNGKGATWNQRATISLNNGATTVSLNNQGEATINSYGRSVSIARGQTVQLGNGESVTCEQNGALRVCATNDMGGRIDTTLTAQGKGVNVDVTAHNVDLGGALVNGLENRHDRDFDRDHDRDPIPQPAAGTIFGGSDQQPPLQWPSPVTPVGL